MFNLGYKEVILNKINGEIVYNLNGYQTIAGYGKFETSKVTENVEQSSVDKAGEVASWALSDLSSVADALQVKVFLVNSRSGAKENIIFDAASTSAADIIGGYTHWTQVYEGNDPKITITGSLTTTVLPGYEDWEVDNFYVTPVVYADLDSRQAPRFLEKTVVTEGNPGLLYGHQLEESRRFGTFANTNPYSEHEGGNSQGIVMDGRYTAFYIKYENDEEKNHEYVKHGFINAEMHMKDYSFVVYVLDEGTNVTDFKAVFPLV